MGKSVFIKALFDRHALCEISRLIDIASKLLGYVIGEQLYGYGGYHRAHGLVHLGNYNDVVGKPLREPVRRVRHDYKRAFTRLYLLRV